MAQGDAGENKEQSMEEILQSIKRIIAEENDGSEPDVAAAPVRNGAHGSDVLELTDLVEEGDAVDPVKEAFPSAPSKKAATNGSDILDSIDSLLSDDAARSSAAALRNLSGSSKSRTSGTSLPAFRSGTSVEDLMIEAMRPMLKDWLDANLPGLVERLVEKEIRKLSH